jgi:hypothetical protein
VVKRDQKRAKKRRKGHPATAASREAGRRNLVEFRATCDGKPASKHGIHTAIQSNGKELPNVPYASEVRAHVSALIDAAVVDLGGSEAVTSMQQQVLESTRLALTIVALGGRYLSQEGIVDSKSRKPHALLSVLGTYANIIRLNAAELGLHRQSRHVGGSALEAKFAQIAEREAQDSINENKK